MKSEDFERIALAILADADEMPAMALKQAVAKEYIAETAEEGFAVSDRQFFYDIGQLVINGHVVSEHKAVESTPKAIQIAITPQGRVHQIQKTIKSPLAKWSEPRLESFNVA